MKPNKTWPPAPSNITETNSKEEKPKKNIGGNIAIILSSLGFILFVPPLLIDPVNFPFGGQLMASGLASASMGLIIGAQNWQNRMGKWAILISILCFSSIFMNDAIILYRIHR
ncbi:hypothetical protein CCAX7_46420 [Capsulimonas corticalis]|uniref:Uncharacterized protein n=1 Tax=Capsulimonas corticalis TaxID=2219043 RepID=A0A9N7QFM7_9BACT|nr:hypothetical protein [Capsulimonas corticalis]BDI32591.1 hypothetical protein CCAX7_46420 [Capsulimonas corticalis]